MPVETGVLVDALADRAERRVQGWTFWTGTLDGYPVVVSKTQKGMANAAAATALAIAEFQPRAIVNQGTAGGHAPDLQVSDIVIGTASVNIGAFKTGARRLGDGSDFTEWRPLDLLRTEGSAGEDPNAWVMRRFLADPALLAGSSQAPDEELDRRERLDALASVLERLPPSDRLLLRLRFGEDLPAREIARIMRFPTLFHVYRRVDKVLNELRGALGSLGVEPEA